MPLRVVWLVFLALELAQQSGSVPAELKQTATGSDAPAPAQKFQPAASVPLADAAAKGDIAALKELLKSGEHPIDQPAGFGMTPLHLASGRDRADAVALLLAHGASPTAADARGWTPLHLAASRGASEAAMELVQSGADVMAKDNDGNRASELAEREGFMTLGRLLGRAEAAVMRRSEEQARSSVARVASAQLPAATRKAAAAAAAAAAATAAATSLGSRDDVQPGPAARPRGGGDTAEAVKTAAEDLLHRHVPRDDSEAAGAGAGAGQGSVPPPSSAAPTAMLLPSLSRSVTAHHKVVYHDGAEGSGDMGVSVEPTDHTQKLLGRAPSKIAKTRDKVAQWFSSADAAQTHAKQFAAARAEAAEKQEAGVENTTLQGAAKEHGRESAGGPEASKREGFAESSDGSSGVDDGLRTKKKKVKTMEELLAVNAKNLHTLPRLSNDTVDKRQHHHAEDKPQHAPARHAELVAAALAAQEEAAEQGSRPTKGMQHPAIRNFLKNQRQADASPYYSGEAGSMVGAGHTEDKLQPVRTDI